MNRISSLTGFALAALLLLGLAAPNGSAAFIHPTQNAVAEGDTATVAIQTRPNTAGSTFDFARKAWVKFDLTGQNPDPDLGAMLRLVFKGSGTGDDPPNDPDWVTAVYGLNSGYSPDESGDNELDIDWTESDFTDTPTTAWEEAPENDEGSDIGFESQATKIGTFDIDTDNDGSITDEKGNPYSVSISTLGDFLQSDNSVTLMLAANESQSSGGDSRDFWRRTDGLVDHDDNPVTPQEDARPTLQFTVIPEPTSLVLMGLAGLLVLSRRAREERRRGASPS